MSSVDVVVPCYNYGRYLRECVTSVLTQEGVDVRVLIIDDCSSDDTPQVANQMCTQDSRVEYHRHEVNRGHIATYNEGLLGWVKAEYCLLLSADDALYPGALKRAAQVFNSCASIGLVYGKRVLFRNSIAEVAAGAQEQETRWRQLSGEQFLHLLASTADNPVCTPTAVVRSSIQKLVGGYRPELPHTGDFEMWLRFGARGSVGVLETKQAYWRSHGQNMREDYRGLDNLRQHQAAFDLFFKHCAERIKDVDELRRLAYVALAENACWAASAAFNRGDADATRRYMSAAREIDPHIHRSCTWRRLLCKRAIGGRAWPAAYSLISSLRQRLRPSRDVGQLAGARNGNSDWQS